MTARPRRTAFTLLEMMIVVAMLAIVMATAVPRLLGGEDRALQLAADRVRDLLLMFAQRQQLSPRPVGIWHDAERNWLVLVVLDVDAAQPDEPASWRPDPAVRPVKLPDSVDPQRGVVVYVDGRPTDAQQWPVTTPPAQPRPGLEIAIYSDDGGGRTIVLPAHAIAAYELGEYGAAEARLPIDLDAAGRRREDW